MYTLLLSQNAEKELKKLEKNTQLRIINALERIRIRPEVHITKLVGETAYKFRVGDYRILIDIDNNKLFILVIKIGHRKNIYD